MLILPEFNLILVLLQKYKDKSLKNRNKDKKKKYNFNKIIKLPSTELFLHMSLVTI